MTRRRRDRPPPGLVRQSGAHSVAAILISGIRVENHAASSANEGARAAPVDEPASGCPPSIPQTSQPLLAQVSEQATGTLAATPRAHGPGPSRRGICKLAASPYIASEPPLTSGRIRTLATLGSPLLLETAGPSPFLPNPVPYIRSDRRPLPADATTRHDDFTLSRPPAALVNCHQPIAWS